MAAAAAAEGSGRKRRNGASGDCAGWRSAAAAGSRGRHRDRVWLWGTGAPSRRGQLGDAAAGDRTAAMNSLPAGTRVWLAAGVTDIRFFLTHSAIRAEKVVSLAAVRVPRTANVGRSGPCASISIKTREGLTVT